MRQKIPAAFLICILFLVFTCRAQKADSARSSDKIHLHTDKNMYMPGETIWFKAYVLSKGLPSVNTTNLYVSLLNENGVSIQQRLVPVIDAVGDGSIPLPDSVKGTNFTLVAYTPAIKNDTDLVYYKQVKVVTKISPVVSSPRSASLQVFPEGGNLVNEVTNLVAFKAMLQNGAPYAVSGLLKDNNGNILDSITALHDGMGSFSMTPHEKEKYYIEWIDNKNELRQTDLPLSISKSITLHTEQVNNYLYYVIQNPVAETPLDKIHIVASLHQNEVYTASIDMTNLPVASGKIPVSNLPAGILQVTAYDNQQHPVAERISFINAGNSGFSASLGVTGQNLAKRGENTIEVEVPDTLISNLSLAIYDASLVGNEQATNIYTDLLLGGDIKGYVNNPAWYFTSTSAQKSKALDLVMQTNGWRKYRRENHFPPGDIDNYITLRGTITNQKKQPQAGQPFTILLQQKDSTKQFLTLLTDSLGRFSKPGLIFFDTATIWYQFDKKIRKSPDMKVNLYQDFIRYRQQGFLSAMTEAGIDNRTDSSTGIPQQLFKQNILDGFTNKGYKLADVTVKGRKWRNDPLLLMDEKYATGIFRGGATAFAFDVMNDPVTNMKGDILDYLVGKVPGLSVGYPKGGEVGALKRLLFRLSYVTTIFINDRQLQFDTNDYAAYSELQSLNITDIAYVKFYDMYPSHPEVPALAIYLKKGDEISASDLEPGLPKLKVSGYSSVKEFYSPDYSVKDGRQPVVDQRTTLCWQPYIITGKSNHKTTIRFYNNDVSSNLFMVLEGMNENGKLVYIEKLLSEKK